MITKDIIVIALIVIIVTIIIVINVKKTLNEKLTNVEIRIPEIEIPQPNIIVKVQRKCGQEEFDVHIAKENIQTPKQTVSMTKKIEGFEQISNNFNTDKIKKYNDEIIKEIEEEEENEEDPMKKYSEYTNVGPVWLCDGITPGANVDQYDKIAGINEIGKIKLEPTGYKFPQPNGYLF